MGSRGVQRTWRVRRWMGGRTDGRDGCTDVSAARARARHACGPHARLE
jgi:hypothetical protein